MKTPICDFVEKYIEQNALRLHMPGHKGLHGYSADITEIRGADSLYAPRGIIRESEENAGRLFGAHTFYSAEGASHAIRAMLHLAPCGKKGAHVFATRGVHRTFISAAALLDFEITWLGDGETSYLAAALTPAALEKALCAAEAPPSAVYVTSPDYLGGVLDIEGLSRVCRARHTLLLVDNAHGAYRKFLPVSGHPIDLGADMCADSAHKTLPALTGGAYLHIAKRHEALSAAAKEAMALFGSTSPSYVILASLDRTNAYLAHGYRERLREFLPHIEAVRAALREKGYAVLGGEELKITIAPKGYGYTGEEMGALLEKENCIPEFYDKDYLVLMVTPEVGKEGLSRLLQVLSSFPRRAPILERPPHIQRGERILSPRRAMLSAQEEIESEKSEGRILGSLSGITCPPAVPILMSGERIEAAHVAAFRYYGISRISVIKELA